MALRANMATRVWIFVFVLLGMGNVDLQAAGDSVETIERVEKLLPDLEKTIKDKLVNDTTLKSVEAKLKVALDQTKEILEDTGGEKSPDNPIVKVQIKILAQLATIRARLHEDKELVNAARVSKLPVPQYNDETVIGKAADKVWEAQKRLAEQLSKSPADDKSAAKLLNDMILAQEVLAWEVAWPFTPDEVKALKKAGELTSEVYLSRRNRGVARITKRVLQAHSNTGRESRTGPFVIYKPTSTAQQKQVGSALTKIRGEAASVWTKGTVDFDAKVAKRLAK